MNEQVLTKTLRDGRTVAIGIEPDGPDPDTLAYWLTINWDGTTKQFKTSPYKLEFPPAPGLTHAVDVPPPAGVKWVTLGLTAAEAAQINDAKNAWVQARQDRKDAERAAVEAAAREAAPGAPAWQVSDMYGYLAAVGGTARLSDGTTVTALAHSSIYYREDGMTFGAADDVGYVYFTEVREATEAERAELEEREARQARRESLERDAAALPFAAVTPGHVDAASLRDLPAVRVSPRHNAHWATVEPLQFLRADEPGGLLWVLTYNGADGDDWSRSNCGSYIVRRLSLTPELAALVAGLREEFGGIDV